MSTDIKTKICKCCNRELSVDNFSTHSKSKDGYVSVCKQCKQNLKNKGNSKFYKISSRELIEELRIRGYKGTLEYIEKHIITV